MDYAEAGVNISLADQAKQRIRRLASRTFTRGVIGGIGSFGGLFALDKKWREPVLVSSADGVGTKLKIAAAMGIHSTVGGDLVNHCVNDILTLGAEPLFFLDYLAMGKMDPNIVEQLVEGMSRACHSAGCALIGGETAEMPGFYAPGEYDLAGFIVGVIERASLKKTNAVKPGRFADRFAVDRIAHQRLFARAQARVRTRRLAAGNLRRRSQQQNRRGAAAPAPVLLADAEDHGRARLAFRDGAHHRRRHHGKSCPASCRAACRRKSSWARGPCRRFFPTSPCWAKLERDELLRTFNMGVGMILVVPLENHRALEMELKRRREKFYRIGQIRRSDPRKPRVAFTGKLPL